MCKKRGAQCTFCYISNEHRCTFFKLIYYIIICLILFLSSSGFATIEINKKPDALKKFDEYAEKVAAQWHLPGIAYVIVQDGKIVRTKCLGYRNVRTKEKINQDTVFRIASLSKTFGAVLIGKIAEKNNFSFEEKVVKFLPDMKFGNQEYTNSLKISDLLQHTTGFGRRAFGSLVEDNKLDYRHISKAAEASNFISKPGASHVYQNYMFNLIADIIEKSSGKDFDLVLREELLDKLSLEDTSSGFEAYLYSQNKALPHVSGEWAVNGPGSFKLSLENFNSNYYKLPAAGGINSSIKNMGKWLQVVMGHYPEVVNIKLLSILQRAHVEDKQFSSTTNWNKASLHSSHYGYGFRIHDYGGDEVIHHGGALNGFRSSLAFIPSKNTGIVILSNASSPVPALLTAAFLDLALDFEFKDYSAQYIKEYLN